MLSPHERSALFDALRPPPGYSLDHAVGTSFSLDLEALLTAPIAFALFEASEADQSEPGVEPVGLLEAIRRHTQRLTVFCQAGQIAVPIRNRVVFAWLEDAVVEIPPPRPHRLFHPKVWLARYRSNIEDRSLIRLLCATRNLTFDTSWDTLLRLESEPYSHRPTFLVDAQAEIAEFFADLASAGGRPLVANRAQAIADLADDLASVPLVPPEPFSEMRLHVFGSRRVAARPFPERAKRALVISPFLSETFLRGLVTDHNVAALISRQESLDRVPADVLDHVERVATLNPAADVVPSQEGPGEVSGGAYSEDGADPAHLFGGLHAKLYAFDSEVGSTIFTGSANATQAAFDGNVEILVELEGPPEAGVDALLADSPGEIGFDDLLLDYVRPDEPAAPSEQDLLETDLDELRRRLAGRTFTATVLSHADHFGLKLQSAEPIPNFDADEIELTVRPVTLTEGQSATRLEAGSAANAEFQVTLEGITAFFAMRASARRGAVRAGTAFLITSELVGAPGDRHSRLLAAMLRDPDRLLRYLLLLLADADPLLSDGQTSGMSRWMNRWVSGGWDQIPLLEVLVRAVDRFPDRLDHIDRLLRDLGDQRDRVLPKGFNELWAPVWESRVESS